jgi:hypothetical protein
MMTRIIRIRGCQDCPWCQPFITGYGPDATVHHWCWNRQHPRSKPGGVLIAVDVAAAVDADCPLPEETRCESAT